MLVNGSRIVTLPGQSATVRSFSGVRLAVIDEAAYCRDELLSAISPMLARSGGRLVLASSAFACRGFFYDSWESGGADWSRLKIMADTVPQIPAAFLEQERRTLGERLYRMEYFGQFCDVLASVFDPDAIERALENGIKPLFALGVEP